MAVFEGANQSFRSLYHNRKDQEAVHQKINKMHQKLVNTSPENAAKYGDKIWQKLRVLYVQAKHLAECEETISLTLLNQLSTIDAGQTAAQRRKLETSEQKRKRIKADTNGSRITSPVSARTSLEQANVIVGEKVAARVPSDHADKDIWIVVKVTRYDKDATKYEVIDEEPGDDEESEQRKYKLPPSCIIPFPKRTDPSSAPDFPNGSQVLAVYPETTALYKATVSAHRKKKTDDYLLEFDDDEEDGVDGLPKRSVPFYHVVPLPEGHHQ